MRKTLKLIDLYSQRVLALFLALCVSIAPGTQAFAQTFSAAQTPRVNPAGAQVTIGGNGGQTGVPAVPDFVKPLYGPGARSGDLSGLGDIGTAFVPTNPSAAVAPLIPIDTGLGVELPASLITGAGIGVFQTDISNVVRPGSTEGVAKQYVVHGANSTVPKPGEELPEPAKAQLAKLGVPGQSLITVYSGATKSQQAMADNLGDAAAAQAFQTQVWDGGAVLTGQEVVSQQTGTPQPISRHSGPVVERKTTQIPNKNFTSVASIPADARSVQGRTTGDTQPLPLLLAVAGLALSILVVNLVKSRATPSKPQASPALSVDLPPSFMGPTYQREKDLNDLAKQVFATVTEKLKTNPDAYNSPQPVLQLSGMPSSLHGYHEYGTRFLLDLGPEAVKAFQAQGYKRIDELVPSQARVRLRHPSNPQRQLVFTLQQTPGRLWPSQMQTDTGEVYLQVIDEPKPVLKSIFSPGPNIRKVAAALLPFSTLGSFAVLPTAITPAFATITPILLIVIPIILTVILGGVGLWLYIRSLDGKNTDHGLAPSTNKGKLRTPIELHRYLFKRIEEAGGTLQVEIDLRGATSPSVVHYLKRQGIGYHLSEGGVQRRIGVIIATITEEDALALLNDPTVHWIRSPN